MSKQERLLILKISGELALKAFDAGSRKPEQIEEFVKAGVKALLKARRRCINCPERS